MHYLDTSVLVAYYCPEPLSEKAEEFIISHATPSISSLTELEIFSALSRKIREGGLVRKMAAQIAARFLGHLDGRFYQYLPVEPEHYRMAREWVGLFTTKLRTFDALHLAIAVSEGLILVTADHELAASARTLSLDVVLLSPQG